MKNKLFVLSALACLSTLSYQPSTFGQGTALTYQGRFNDAAGPATGTYDFRFTVRDALTGGSPVGANPLSATLTVSNGLFTVTLDPGAGVFTSEDRWLEIAVRTNGAASFTTLSPRQKITAAPYAVYATGAGTAATAGSVAAANITGTLVSAQLADTIALGTNDVTGQLDVYRTAAGTPAITLFGNSSQISTYGSDGLEQIRLWGPTYGELLLRNSLANNATAVTLTAQGSTGGRLALNNTNGSSRAILEGENTGGLLTLYTADGNAGAILYGNEGAGSGSLSLRNTNGSSRLRAYGGPDSGRLAVYDDNGTLTIDLTGQSGTVKLGSAGQLFAPGGEENLRIIRGVVNSAGSILGGQGFTVAHTGTGAYTVTFTTSFTGLPTVTTSAQSGLSRVATTTNVGNSSAQFRTFDATGTAVDAQFHFIAMGPR